MNIDCISEVMIQTQGPARYKQSKTVGNYVVP